MVQLKADGAISAFLVPIKERAEILDDRGTVLGYFEPAVDADAEEALYRHAITLFDLEEVERARTVGGRGATTEEVLDRLRSLGSA